MSPICCFQSTGGRAAGVFLGFWLLLAPAVVLADAGGSGLMAVLNEALANHPRIRERQGQLRAAGFELEAAQWGRWPTFGLDSEALDEGFEVVSRLEQPLWSGGRISGQIEVSDATERSALAALSETRVEVLLETGQQFFEVLRLGEKLRYAHQDEREHRRLLGMIQRRVASEISPASDAVLAASRLQRAKTTRVQTARQLADARSGLERAVGRPVVDPRAPADIRLPGQALASWLEQARLYSPERRRLGAELERAGAEITLARSQALPTVVLGYRQTLTDLNDNRDDGGEVYLAVSVETGAGLSSRATVQAASSRRMAVRDALADQDRELRRQIQSLWAEVQALEAQVAPMKVIVEGSEAMVASYLRQFQVSKKSWLDVLNAQGEKAQAYYLQTDTEMPLLLAKLRLKVLAGEIRPTVRNANNDR